MVFRISDEELEEAMRQNAIEDAKPKKKGCCGKACKTFMRLSFSHIGLCILLALYCAGGALLFIAIERPLEEDNFDEQKLMSQEVLNETGRVGEILKKYHNVDPADKMVKDGKSVPLEHFTQVIASYQDYIKDSIQNRNYAGDVSGEPEYAWNFPSSLLFTVSTITAIGYGHIAPKTENGQVVTILYCIIGIPLTLMFLANVGDALALGIRWFWGKISSYKKRKQEVDEDGEVTEIETKDIQVPVLLTLLTFVIYIAFGSIVFKYWECWTFISSVYFILCSLTTIGFGDLVPGWDSMGTVAGKFKLAFSSLYIVFGLAFLTMAFSLIIEKVSSAAKNASKKLAKQEKLDAEMAE